MTVLWLMFWILLGGLICLVFPLVCVLSESDRQTTQVTEDKREEKRLAYRAAQREYQDSLVALKADPSDTKLGRKAFNLACLVERMQSDASQPHLSEP